MSNERHRSGLVALKVSSAARHRAPWSEPEIVAHHGAKGGAEVLVKALPMALLAAQHDTAL